MRITKDTIAKVLDTKILVLFNVMLNHENEFQAIFDNEDTFFNGIDTTHHFFIYKNNKSYNDIVKNLDLFNEKLKLHCTEAKTTAFISDRFEPDELAYNCIIIEYFL